MAFSPDFRDYVLEMLEPISTKGTVTARSMFGGAGIYLDGVIFALITGEDVLYFKVDKKTAPDFEAEDMEPFRPFPDKMNSVMPYWQVPPRLMEDGSELCEWAMRAWEASRRAPTKKRKKKIT